MQTHIQTSVHNQPCSSSTPRGNNSGSRFVGRTSPLPHLLPDTTTQPDLSSLDSLSLSSSQSSEQSLPRMPLRTDRPSSEGPHPLPGRPQVLSSSLRSSSSMKACRKKESFSTKPNEENYAVGVLHHRRKTRHSHNPRSEPDGQSDVSGTSPDMLLCHPDSSCGLHRRSASSGSSPPPSSPVLTTTQPRNNGEYGHAKAVTPAMIQSALDALEGIQDKVMPISFGPSPLHVLNLSSRQSPVLPEDVTSALTAWISSQSLHKMGLSINSSRSSVNQTPLVTPPPTPKQMLASKGLSSSGDCQGISVGELISALTVLICPGEKVSSSRESYIYSVPACTPIEGLSEWTRLGIDPEEVILALSGLTIQQVLEYL